MSLIEEALRRVQQEVTASSERRAAPAPPDAKTDQPELVHPWPTTGAPAAPPTARTKNAGLKGPLAAIALAAALSLGIGFWLERGGRKPAVRLAERSAPETVVSQPAPRSAPPMPTRPTASGGGETLVLSGIAEGSGEPYAVINGQVVSIGGLVGDSTLLEIAGGAVRMRRPDGTDVVLHLPPS